MSRESDAGHSTVFDAETVGVEPGVTPLADHLPVLDSVRGIAILMVVVCHFQTGSPSGGWADSALRQAGRFGWAGVDLFFVLSGFLITRILLRQVGRPDYFRNFFARRTLRIFPLYYLALVVMVVVMPAMHLGAAFTSPTQGTGTWWLWAYLTNVGWAVSPEHAFVGPAVNVDHFWSLAVEEHFYLVWPLAVAWLVPRRLAVVCGVGIVLALILRVLTYKFVGWQAAYVLTPMRMDGLLAGSLLAMIEARRGLPRPSVMFAGFAATLLSFIVFAVVATRFVSLGSTFNTVGMSFTTCAFSFVVAAAARLRFDQVPASRMFAVLGKYSYGIYVWHILVMQVFLAWGVRRLLDRTLGPTGAASNGAFIVITSVGAFAVAVLSFYAYERHFLKLKRFFGPAASRLKIKRTHPVVAGA